MIFKLRIWSLTSFLKKSHKQFYDLVQIYQFYNLSDKIINKHASWEARTIIHSFCILATCRSWATVLPSLGSVTNHFLHSFLRARWKEYCSKSTVNSLCCWKGKENTRLFLLLQTKARPIGRKVIHEKDVSFGQGIILEAVRVRKINEMLRACRRDETHA